MKANTTKIKLQDVIMDAVVEENPQQTADVTQKPVERGQDIADHMKVKGAKVHLKGFMVIDAANKLETLKKYQNEATLLKYIGRNAFDNMVITNLNTNHSVTNADGFDYDITLEEVRIAVPETFEVKAQNPETKEQDATTSARVKKSTNAGRKQVKSTQATSGSSASSSGVSSASTVMNQLTNMSLADTLKAGLMSNAKPKKNIPQKVQIGGREVELY